MIGEFGILSPFEGWHGSDGVDALYVQDILTRLQI